MSHHIETIKEQASHERIIRPRHGLAALDFAELWRFRELFLVLTWRNILIRYKQTYIGIAWAVLQPFCVMVVFTMIVLARAVAPCGPRLLP